MLNKIMTKKQVIILIVLGITLFIFNSVLMNVFKKIISPSLNTKNMINREQVSSQRLVDRTWKVIKKNYYDGSLNHQNWDRWKYHYKNRIKTDEDARIAISTMLASLDDPYSRYLNKEEFAEQNTSIDSKISGIGVTIYSNAGKITVLSVIEGTPAFNAGIKPNDIILSVDNQAVNGKDISEVAQLVRGPENSVVSMIILRDKNKFNKKIKRKEIKIKTVKSSVDKNIGYIQILSFIGLSTSNEFIEALENTEKTEGLILDLRGNPGGLLPNAIFIANLFIPKGNLVSIVGRDGFKQDVMAQNNSYVIDKPMVVLIDETSASASEILSGALKDYKKAKLIGTKTYGKGMVQQIMPLPNESGLNLTIAKYLTPLGFDINQKGINPDIEVKFTIDDIKKSHDVQLERAKTVVQDSIKKKKTTAPN